MVTSYDRVMETMNIYVISEVWDHDGATVIGAATDRTGAEQIGDRQKLPDPGWSGAVNSWAPWEERVDEASGSCTWYRVGLLADGSVHHALSQEIVCVPLAGWPPFGLLHIDLAGEIRVSEPRPAPAITRESLLKTIELIRLGQAETRRLWGSDSPRIRVGPGAAREWLERAADSTLPAEVRRPIEIDGGLLTGLQIKVDPSIPPDMIRVGPMVYVIQDDGPIIRIDTRSVPIDGFTTAPD